jgi:ubiquitin-like protein ATG12
MASLAGEDSTPESGNANDAHVKQNNVPEKVKVNLQATGRAQILKRNKFKLAKDDKFLKLQMFLRAQLKLEQSEALFLFINSSFVPRADETLGNLYENFNVGGELIVNYSREISWG